MSKKATLFLPMREESAHRLQNEYFNFFAERKTAGEPMIIIEKRGTGEMPVPLRIVIL